MGTPWSERVAITPTPLFEPLQLLSGPHTYYTADATTRIDKLTVANTDSVPRSVTLYWVPNGQTISDPAAVIIPASFLQPGESRDLWQFIGHVLAQGDQIGAGCDDGGVVNFFGSGTLVTAT